jgi:outer membrane protein TolC
VNAVVPLDLLLMRNTMVRRQEQVVNQAAGMRKVSEATIRQQVIVQYQALVLARATQQAAQEAWQSASINKKIADKRFRDGDIQIDEQMAVQDFYSKAVQAQAEAQNRYQTAQLLLEDMIGTSINNIILGK